MAAPRPMRRRAGFLWLQPFAVCGRAQRAAFSAGGLALSLREPKDLARRSGGAGSFGGAIPLLPADAPGSFWAAFTNRPLLLGQRDQPDRKNRSVPDALAEGIKPALLVFSK